MAYTHPPPMLPSINTLLSMDHLHSRSSSPTSGNSSTSASLSDGPHPGTFSAFLNDNFLHPLDGGNFAPYIGGEQPSGPYESDGEMFGAFVGAASYRNTECELGGAPARFDHSRVPAIGILSGNASQHPVGPALNDDASPHASMPDEFFGQGIPSLYDFNTPTPPEISFLPGDDVEDPNPKEIDSGIPEPRSTEALHQTEVDSVASRPSETTSSKYATAKERQSRQQAFKEDYNSLMQEIQIRIRQLAEKHSKTETYIQQLLFNGGAGYLKEVKPNIWNAWSHCKYVAVNTGRNLETDRISLAEIQSEYIDEYYKLTDVEKKQCLEVYKTNLQARKTAQRLTARGKLRDVDNTVEKMSDLMLGLTSRAGVEGMFCIVRNSSSYSMSPRWFFTSSELERFLEIAVRRWNTDTIGTQMEAFAIAGSNTDNLFQTSKNKAAFLKSQIRDKISDQLIAISHNKKARMQYKTYHEQIVERYRIDLVGWPSDIAFKNPSYLSDRLEPLRMLRDALVDGTCKFVKLTEIELEERRACTNADREAGRIPPKRTRRVRRDAGTKRNRGRTATRETSGSDTEGDSSGDEEQEHATQKRTRRSRK